MTNRITYYYQTFTDLTPVLVANTPVTHIHLSSIHFGNNPDGNPYIHINNNDPNDPIFNKMWEQIDQAHKLGIKIVLMVGGAGGAFNDLFNNYDIYFKMLVDTINQHPQICGVDLDIEEGVELTNIQKLMDDLLHQFGNTFLFSFAPLPGSLENDNPGMGGFIYKDLYNSIQGRYIDYFNCQVYGDFSKTQFVNIVNNGYPSNKIVMGMISGQDFDNVLSTLTQIKDSYPDMGGTYIWEYFNAPKDWHNQVYNALNKSGIWETIKNFVVKFTDLSPFIDWMFPQADLTKRIHFDKPKYVSIVDELD
jgi:hypothetical protein